MPFANLIGCCGQNSTIPPYVSIGIAFLVVAGGVYLQMRRLRHGARLSVVRRDNAAAVQRMRQDAKPRHAVVVGGTSGIGRGIALKLASTGVFNVTVLGRSRERGQAVVAAMQDAVPADAQRVRFAFEAVDASSVQAAVAKGREWDAERPLHALVLTAGVASIAGYSPTEEGLDVKLATHYYARCGFIAGYGPALERAGGEARVVSVLSAGVHSAYKEWQRSPDLAQTYSLVNAANAAGMYNDIGLQALARTLVPNVGVSHTCPGVVATRWGTEMPAPLRWVVRRLMSVLGKPAEVCAEFMSAPLLQPDLAPPVQDVHLWSELAEPVSKVSEHEAAASAVWEHTRHILQQKANFVIQE